MQNETAEQPIDPTQNYNPGDLTITDPTGRALPDDHPAVQNPQVGRPISRGDLTLPENQPLAEALASGDVRRRDLRQQVQDVGGTLPTETAPQPATATAPQPATATAPQPATPQQPTPQQPIAPTGPQPAQPVRGPQQPADTQPSNEPNPPA